MVIHLSVLPPDDWQTYKEIQLEALREDPQAFGSKYADWVNATDEKWKERPNNPDTIIILAKDGETPLGLVGVHFEENEMNGKEGHVWGMFVSKKYRGQGLGRKLMEKIIERVQKTTRITNLQLMVNPHQEVAIQLYVALGFKTVRTKKLTLGDGNSYDLLVMELRLE